MEAKPYYDAEGFLKLQKTISSAGDAVTTFLARSRESGHVDSKTYGQIASATGDRFAANANGYGNVDIFLQKYDVNNEYLQAMTRLKTLKDRMTTLEEVMEKTRLMWDEAVKKADSRVGNIQNMKEIYGIAGFGVAWEAGKKEITLIRAHISFPCIRKSRSRMLTMTGRCGRKVETINGR